MLERLQKIIARAGIASRRHAEELIRSGQVRVNGVVVSKLGAKADPERDRVEAAGRIAERPPEPSYLVLHKPVHVVSTMSDPEGRTTLRHLLRGLAGGIFPVGRLDYAASGLMLLTSDGELADRIVTTSPDVTVSTNLGAWVNQRGLFRRSDMADVFAQAKIASAQKWSGGNKGQHVELGIAESNLFLMLAAAGLSGDLFGTRLFPIGTLYDPFIARGLDSLNYACYQDARFLLVATPSGITLGPEGGAHQSINPPLIALGQPGLRHYEPAFADELALMMQEAFRLIDDPSGECTYLRLSTRNIRQIERTDDSWREGALAGGYWLREPADGAEAAIVAMGAVMPEALAAWEELSQDLPGLGLLAITSPDLLHRGWTAAQAARWNAGRNPSHIEQLLSCLAPRAGLVTVADAAPASLSWIGGVLGQRVAPLGVEKFGQTGTLADLYAAYRLDGAAITEGVAEILLQNG